MDWNVVQTFIKPEFLLVVVVAWVLGFMIRTIPKIPNWSIVFIVTLYTIVMVIFLNGLSAESIMQGILCGAVAVYGNQLVKQSKQIGKGDGE
jgi:MFS superfamily sulfate permease-like transporter